VVLLGNWRGQMGLQIDEMKEWKAGCNGCAVQPACKTNGLLSW
jgi:hypothetical protein